MALKAEAISKLSGTEWVLKDVTFEAASGEVTGIAETAGTASRMLFRILTRAEKPTSGSISVDPQDVIRRTSVNRGVVSLGPAANTGALPSLTNFFKRDPDERCGILERVKTVIDRGATVVLIDGDGITPQPTEADLEALGGLARANRLSILYAASRFENLIGFCDRVVLLENGEVLQAGTPGELYLAPKSSAAARMTGRINIFEARRLSSSKAEIPEFQTIIGEHRLKTGGIEKARLGALNRNLDLAIRPEHISISFGASFPEDNLLKAVVTGVKFMGPTTVVKLDAGGLAVEALVMRLVGLKSGDECLIGMPPDRIMIFAG